MSESKVSLKAIKKLWELCSVGGTVISDEIVTQNLVTGEVFRIPKRTINQELRRLRRKKRRSESGKLG